MADRHECDWGPWHPWCSTYRCVHPGCYKNMPSAEVAKRLNEYETLKTENEAVLDAANSLLGLIDCLGGGFSIDDAGPDRKTLAKLVDYPNHMNKKLALLTEEQDGETR